ncbi:unnamed protein product [Oreochromis niloticus]|uniref:Integrase catalytic domain-containing protein n=1 Tax=Oreochromis niloticus TaxID=8128 RepID=A0A669BXQ1_ORENI|nr:unnamed protein product [Mustela putorius furo]
MAEQILLKRAYYDPSHPGSFCGVQKLIKSVQDETGTKINAQTAQNFLAGQDAYTLHRAARLRFPRNRVFVPRPLYQFQADLCDMKSLSEHNDGYQYLLTVIDVFSKKAYARVLKNKTGVQVTKAFEAVLKDSQIPQKLQTDSGKEFFNSSFQSLMKKHGINHFATGSDLKASVCERFNRTLKSKMYRYFTAQNTRRYIDVLQDLLQSYNTSYHRSIKMAPNQVKSDNVALVFQNLYGTSSRCRKKPMKFKKGDLVRLSKVRGVFDKRYEQTFTSEVFTIDQCIPRDPPVYKIKDYDGEEIIGSFYEHELQKIALCKDKLYHIDKILSKRKQRGQLYFLVKWRNWPEKFNSWIKASELKNLT